MGKIMMAGAEMRCIAENRFEQSVLLHYTSATSLGSSRFLR